MTFRIRAVVTALAVAGSMAVAGTAAASATVPTVDTTTAAVTTVDEIAPLSARGCTGRNGPGDVNLNCVDVTGTSLYVKQIRGSMESSSVPLNPQICNVTVHAWGTYASGAPFNRTGTSRCSSIGYAYVDFNPYVTFKDNTKICSRTQFEGQWSNPACITVRK